MIRNRRGEPKKGALPEYVGKSFDCGTCGGSFVITRHTKVRAVTLEVGKPKELICTCPHCCETVVLVNDPHKHFRAKLSAYVLSQVAPIKSIEDENIRLPMQELLDDFNALIQG